MMSLNCGTIGVLWLLLFLSGGTRAIRGRQAKPAGLHSDEIQKLSNSIHWVVPRNGDALRSEGDNKDARPIDDGVALKPFSVLMQAGSVGSSWLSDLLNSHPNIECRGEQFQRSPVKRMGRYLAGSGKTLNVQALGFKVKLPVLQGIHNDSGPFKGQDRLPEFLSTLRALDAKVICLYRRNAVKHAVSQERHAVQRNLCHQWQTTATSERGEECLTNVQSTPLQFDKVRIQVQRMQTFLAEMDRVCLDEAVHLDSAGQLRVWRVAYEDLAYGQHVTSGKDMLDALQRWLGVEPSTLHSNVMKMTPPRLRDTVVNFDKLVSDFGAYYGENSLELKQLLEE